MCLISSLGPIKVNTYTIKPTVQTSCYCAYTYSVLNVLKSDHACTYNFHKIWKKFNLSRFFCFFLPHLNHVSSHAGDCEAETNLFKFKFIVQI